MPGVGGNHDQTWDQLGTLVLDTLGSWIWEINTYKHPANGALEPSIVKGRVLTSVSLLQPQVKCLAHWILKSRTNSTASGKENPNTPVMFSDTLCPFSRSQGENTVDCIERWEPWQSGPPWLQRSWVGDVGIAFGCPGQRRPILCL